MEFENILKKAPWVLLVGAFILFLFVNQSDILIKAKDVIADNLLGVIVVIIILVILKINGALKW